MTIVHQIKINSRCSSAGTIHRNHHLRIGRWPAHIGNVNIRVATSCTLCIAFGRCLNPISAGSRCCFKSSVNIPGRRWKQWWYCPQFKSKVTLPSLIPFWDWVQVGLPHSNWKLPTPPVPFQWLLVCSQWVLKDTFYRACRQIPFLLTQEDPPLDICHTGNPNCGRLPWCRFGLSITDIGNGTYFVPHGYRSIRGTIGIVQT